MLSLALIEPVLDAKLVRALPVTVVAAMLVADCVPVTSPARPPVKFVALSIAPSVKARVLRVGLRLLLVR